MKKLLGLLICLCSLSLAVTIGDIYFDDVLYTFDPEGLLIDDSPELVIDVTGSNVNFNAFVLLVDGQNVLISDPSNYEYNTTEGKFKYQFTTQLAVGPHYFEFAATDDTDASSSNFTATVKANEVSLIDSPIPYPSPATENVAITYRLQKSGDISLYVYNLKGMMVYKERFSKGDSGTHVGYNEPSIAVDQWNNGVYIALVVGKVDGKQTVIGRTKFIVAK